MKKQMIRFGLTTLCTLGLLLGGCQKFDDPAPGKIYTDQDLMDEGCEFKDIKEIKDLFYNDPTLSATPYTGSLTLTDNYVIKGKVISNDYYGNVYRSIYLQDASGAIEVKIGSTQLYNDFRVGQWVYVKTKGLVLGSYRFMLSLGSESEDPDYNNGYIDQRSIIESQILPGEYEGMTAADTLVITSGSQLRDPEDLGRLVRFKGLKSEFKTFTSNTTDEAGSYFYADDMYPQFLMNDFDKNGDGIISSTDDYESYGFTSFPNPYVSWDEMISVEDLGGVVSWAFSYYLPDGNVPRQHNYYGSALFSLGGYYYVVRSSGYSRFARQPVPADGELVDISAIFTKYSSRTGRGMKYQLVLNDASDVVPAQ